jgi:hypothetical protein
MTKMKRLVYHLIGFILTSLLSCNDQPSTNNERANAYKTIHIIMNSPFACYNEIKLDKTGSGISIFGYRDKQTGKANIESRKAFLIQIDSIKLKVNDAVNRIRNRRLVYSTSGLDLYQFVVEIDGNKYVDKYGEDSLVNNFLVLLLPYAHIDPKIEQCDYFYYLKQNKSNKSE